MSLAETVVLGADGRERLHRAIAERFARASERLAPRPRDEDPLYLVALSVEMASRSEDPTGELHHMFSGLDARTIYLMLMHLVVEVSHPHDVDRREQKIRRSAAELARRGYGPEVVAVSAARMGSAEMLGYSRASAAVWAGRRLELLMGDRVRTELEAELDA